MNESNADKALPGIPIVFGNPPQEHRVIFTLRAFIELEKMTGKNPMGGEMFATANLTELAQLIYCGMLHEKNGLTLDDVLDQVTLEDLKGIGEYLQAAFNQATPPPSQKKTSPEESPTAGTEPNPTE